MRPVTPSYAAVSGAYADHLVDELDRLPFESWLLLRVVELAGDHPVVEVGCGPGHVTDFLARAGVTATGMDLTPAMVEEARRRFPGVRCNSAADSIRLRWPPFPCPPE